MVSKQLEIGVMVCSTSNVAKYFVNLREKMRTLLKTKYELNEQDYGITLQNL